MTNRFEELVTSPYDDEPGGNRPWLKWLPWIGVAMIAVVVAATVLGGGTPDEEPSEVGATGATSSVPGATESEGIGTGTGTGLDAGAPEDDPLPELAFDTSALGSEQVLEPAKPIQGWSLSRSGMIAETDTFSLGAISDSQYQLMGATGTQPNPYRRGFGGPSACFAMAGWEGFNVDCFTVDDEAGIRPLFTGLIGTGVVSWGMLPEDAAVGVLVVNGRNAGWQRPTNSVVAFRYDVFPGNIIELSVLDESGEEIARATRHRPAESTTLQVPPITGYGDFTDVPFEDIDFREVEALLLECVNARGFDAALSRPMGNGLTPLDDSAIPTEDNAEANETIARCLVGLNLPDRPEHTQAQRQEWYETNVELHACLVDLGYEIDAAPPFDDWILQPSDTRWDPVLLMPILFPSKATEALDACNH